MIAYSLAPGDGSRQKLEAFRFCVRVRVWLSGDSCFCFLVFSCFNVGHFDCLLILVMS